MIIMLLVDFILIAGVIYPIIIRYLCHDPHPYKILYASICSVLTAFFSADSNLVLQLNMRHGKESLGIRRRINGVVHPLFSIFARGGSALVTTIGFIMIWRSYSSLTIPFTDILWITFTSFGISFVFLNILNKVIDSVMFNKFCFYSNNITSKNCSKSIESCCKRTNNRCGWF